MDFLRLTAGLLLPWLGGAMWLIYLERRFAPGTQASLSRQAGYGFFLGYAALAGLILASDTLLGRVSWAGMVAVLALLAGGGVVALRLSPAPKLWPGARPAWRLGPQQRTLFALVAGWTLLHVLLVASEALNQPLYPWDAWLAWVYRAKAWFLGGAASGTVAPTQWLATDSAKLYTIDAWHYPPLPSLIPWWAALSLGRWSETLIALPAVLAGLAIGLGLYGQCRASGMGRLFGLGACFLLYSIPLFGTHIALAGYADLWMAGFAGLGFVALIRGATGGGRFQTLLGFGLLALAMAVKNEGSVWFLAALLLQALMTWRGRSLLAAAALLALLILATNPFGVSHIDIPLLGTLGVIEGRLHIPFIGNFELKVHDILPPYRDNFFLLGSWHLLWVLVAAALLLAIASRRPFAQPGRRAAAAFIVVFLATQLFIFGFTDQGIWADTYTAINRLPLHFLPALIYASLLVVHLRLRRGDALLAEPALAPPGLGWRPGRLLLAGAVAFLLVATGLVALMARGLPAEPVPARAYAAGDLNFVMGVGRVGPEGLVIERFENGYALLSSGPVAIDAAGLPFLRLELEPLGNRKIPTLFWRRADAGEVLFRRDLADTGRVLVDLASDPEWRGTVTEFGFLFYADQEGREGPLLGPLALEADSLSLRLQRLWTGWTAPEFWSQRSINFIWGGAERQIFRLPVVVIAWLLLTLVLSFLLQRPRPDVRSHALMLSAVAAFLVAWATLDLRWTVNGVRQSAHTLEKYRGTDEEQRLARGLDAQVYGFVRDLKAEHLPAEPARILIVGDDSMVDYLLLRAKYHLLPHSALVSRSIPAGLTPGGVDYLLFFGDASGIAETPGWTPDWSASLESAGAGTPGALFRTRPVGTKGP